MTVVATLASASSSGNFLPRFAPDVCDWIASTALTVPSAGSISPPSVTDTITAAATTFPLSAVHLQAHLAKGEDGSAPTVKSRIKEFANNVSMIGTGGAPTRTRPFPKAVVYPSRCSDCAGGCPHAAPKQYQIMSSMIAKGLDMYRARLCKPNEVPLNDIVLAWEFSSAPNTAPPGVDWLAPSQFRKHRGCPCQQSMDSRRGTDGRRRSPTDGSQ